VRSSEPKNFKHGADEKQTIHLSPGIVALQFAPLILFIKDADVKELYNVPANTSNINQMQDRDFNALRWNICPVLLYF
jgi:hypothetical protein